jgi:hypothetical protein
VIVLIGAALAKAEAPQAQAADVVPPLRSEPYFLEA